MKTYTVNQRAAAAGSLAAGECRSIGMSKQELVIAKARASNLVVMGYSVFSAYNTAVKLCRHTEAG